MKDNKNMCANAATNLGKSALIDNTYRVIDFIGHGSMCEVFLVEDMQSHEHFAVKILKEQCCVQTTLKERFIREAEFICNTNHPNLVRGYARGTYLGCPYLVMEYVDGKSLTHVHESNMSMSVEEALDVLTQCAQGLQALFQTSGFSAHRDIKPANIMQTECGTIKLLDFGIAKTNIIAEMPLETQFVGSLKYVSPEQIEDSSRVDIRTDIYALGAVFFELLTAEYAYSGKTHKAMLDAHYSSTLPQVFAKDLYFEQKLSKKERLHKSALCNEILRRCLAKLPEQRFQTPAELLAFLENADEFNSHVPWRKKIVVIACSCAAIAIGSIGVCVGIASDNLNSDATSNLSEDTEPAASEDEETANSHTTLEPSADEAPVLEVQEHSESSTGQSATSAQGKTSNPKKNKDAILGSS